MVTMGKISDIHNGTLFVGDTCQDLMGLKKGFSERNAASLKSRFLVANIMNTSFQPVSSSAQLQPIATVKRVRCTLVGL